MLVTHVNFLFGNSGIRRNIAGEHRRRRRALQLKLPACACVSTTLLISARVNCECNTWARKKNEKGRDKKRREIRPSNVYTTRTLDLSAIYRHKSLHRNGFRLEKCFQLYPSRNNGTFHGKGSRRATQVKI